MALGAGRRGHAVVGVALGLLAPLALATGESRAETVLRVAAEADLKSIDPIWTTASITAGHGFMIYDQLFAEDSKLQVKPQMVDTWKSSPDGMAWSFTLRPGLKWHDGSPT